MGGEQGCSCHPGSTRYPRTVCPQGLGCARGSRAARQGKAVCLHLGLLLLPEGSCPFLPQGPKRDFPSLCLPRALCKSRHTVGLGSICQTPRYSTCAVCGFLSDPFSWLSSSSSHQAGLGRGATVTAVMPLPCWDGLGRSQAAARVPWMCCRVTLGSWAVFGGSPAALLPRAEMVWARLSLAAAPGAVGRCFHQGRSCREHSWAGNRHSRGTFLPGTVSLGTGSSWLL